MVTLRPIVFDIDGVLADFVCGFIRLAEGILKHQVKQKTHDTCWNDFGLTDSEIDLVWVEVKKQERLFWRYLPALANTKDFAELRCLNDQREIYFVTNRVGEKAKLQTEQWLASYGIPKPTVILSNKKVDIANAVGASHIIEDKLENVLNGACYGIKCYLIDRPYNQTDLPIPRVKTLSQFFEAVREGR